MFFVVSLAEVQHGPECDLDPSCKGGLALEPLVTWVGWCLCSCPGLDHAERIVWVDEGCG